MHIEDYVEEFVLKVEQYTGGEFSPRIAVTLEQEQSGTFSDTLVLAGGYKLDVTLTVEMRSTVGDRRYPHWIIYAFQLRRHDELIWRFDNLPYHPKISTYPHHKHEGQNARLRPGGNYERTAAT